MEKLSRSQAFEKLCKIMETLRSPEGCPWDREQTPFTLRSSFIEETFEAIDAINAEESDHVKEELGDVFFNLVFIARCYEEQENFDVADSLNDICEKLVRRHPHVFGDKKVKDSDAVVVQWDKIKNEVEGRKTESVIDQVPKSFPPLLKAYKILKKVAKQGFVWNNREESFNKILEEVEEVKTELSGNNKMALEEELGDLLLSVVGFCRDCDVDPTAALERAVSKFSNRYRYVEQRMTQNEIPMDKSNTSKMLEFWNQAKNNLKG